MGTCRFLKETRSGAPPDVLQDTERCLFRGQVFSAVFTSVRRVTV
jgi:hypothetical protein